MNPTEAIFELLPLASAMPDLVPTATARREAWAWVSENAGRFSPALQAGLWLYVDDPDRSHTVSQGIDTPTGAYWHGVMHRREGDFSNAKYWFRQVGAHPVIAELGYDPFDFVDRCARRYLENPAELVDLQRREWQALFAHSEREGA